MFKNCIVLMFLVAGMNHSVLVFGDQDQKESDGVANVVVTATRSEQEAVLIPASITIITQDEISASGAQHLADVLRSQGAVQITDSFGDGSQVTVGMRGFAETANANTLILVDGRRLNNSDIGSPDLNSVSLKDIERIEIIQGSAAILYGDQAVGGVINIITRAPQELSFNAQATLGSYDRVDWHAQMSQRFDNGLAFRVSAQERETDNYREHNAIDYRNALLYGAYYYEQGSVFLEKQQIRDEIETPGALFQDELLANRRQSINIFNNDYSLLETDIYRIGVNHRLLANWSLQAEYTSRESEGDFLLSFRSFPGSIASQDRLVKTFSPRLQGRFPTAQGEVLLTAGYDQESTDYELQSILGRSANEQETTSLYLQSIVPISNQLSLTMGVRSAELKNRMVDDFSFAGGIDVDDRQTVGEIGLEIRASAELRHFIRFAENYRFAKIDENTTIFPQPGTVVLDTQTGLSTEIGVEWQRDSQSAKALFYRLDLDDEIIYDPLSFQNINIDNTHRQGFVFEAATRYAAGVGLLWGYTYTDSEIMSGDYEGNRVPFIAEHMAKFAVDYRIKDDWHFYLDAHYMGERYFSGDFANRFSRLESNVLTNMKLAYHCENWQFSLGIKNLFDKAYSDFGAIGYNSAAFANEPSYFPSPERSFWLAMRYHLN